MSRRIVPLFFTLFFAFFSLSSQADTFNNKKILFINSYHEGYEWSDGITDGIRQTLRNTGITLKIAYMDTKRQRDKDKIKAIALKMQQIITEFKPDVVIASDDNAAKYVIKPFYKDADLPFVFCGVNWDASPYGFPYSNVTGMEEVSLIKSVVNNLKAYTQGERVGLLSIDAISGKRNVEHFEQQLGKKFDKAYYVKTFAEWQQKYQQLQTEVDMLVFENPKGIKNWDNQTGLNFIENNTKIPSGTTHIWLAPYALLSIAKIPQEQGSWAATTALRILNGEAVKNIPIVQNEQGRLFINLKLGNKLGLVFKPELMEIAEIIR